MKKLDIYAWELIPENERTMQNSDFAYIVHHEMTLGQPLRNYTYKVEGNNIYIGRWYRAVEEIEFSKWQTLPQNRRSVKLLNGRFKFYRGII